MHSLFFRFWNWKQVFRCLQTLSLSNVYYDKCSFSKMLNVSLGTVGTFYSKGCHFGVKSKFYRIWWLVHLGKILPKNLKLSYHFSVCWEADKSHFCDFWLYFWSIFLHIWILCKIMWYLHSKPSKNVKKKKKKFSTPDPTSNFAQMI